MKNLTFVSQEELVTVRPFTLTSGYNPENTRFVRVKDGYSIQADPALVRDKNKPGQWRKHHIHGAGYLYRMYPGYVMATTKQGDRGWSSWVSMPTPKGFSRFISFNPFIGEKAVLQELFTPEVPYPVSMGWSIISVPIDEPLPEETEGNTYESYYDEEGLLQAEPIGKWHLPVTRVYYYGNPDNTYYSTESVRGVAFKGIRHLLEKLSKVHYAMFMFPFNGRRYCYDLHSYQEKGEVKPSPSTCLEDLFVENFYGCSPVLKSQKWDTMYGDKYTPGIEPGTYYRLTTLYNSEGLNYSSMVKGFQVWEPGALITLSEEESSQLSPVEGTHWVKI